MALVTIQRSPSPSNSPAESEDTVDAVEELGEPSDKSSPNRQRRSKTALKRLKKFFHTVRFISKLRPFSESYFAVKGAALILPQNEHECTYATRKITRSGQGEIQNHLQAMFHLLRPQDTIKVAVKLESSNSDTNRYMAVVSCIGRQDTEESVILGIDCEETATIGLVFPIWADTDIKLEGDGGFTVTSNCIRRVHVFKPVSVQAMWSALQSLNKVVKVARDNHYIPSGLTHTWVPYYESKLSSSRIQMTEWYTNETIEYFRSQPIYTENEDEESVFKKKIRVELKNVMMRADLDEASCKTLRTELENVLDTDLKEYRSFIDNEILTILGQLDSPTLIKDFLYLGSEWNASNMEELLRNGVGHIMNISKEIDNFFPGTFEYMNVREWDSEETELIKHWEDTYKFIIKARLMDSKVLVHCKMGISRSASTVMAFLMKEYAMTRQEAYDYTKDRRSCIMPNSAFWDQLETYEGILAASRQREVFKSKSAVNLTEISSQEEDPLELGECSGGHFLGHDLFSPHLHHTQSLPGHFDDSVFLPPLSSKDTDLCKIDAEFELSSRSADSADDSLSDHPSPKPKEEHKGFHIGGDDEEDMEDEVSDGMEDIAWDKRPEKKEKLSESGDDTQAVLPKKLKSDQSWIKLEAEETQDSGATEADDKSAVNNATELPSKVTDTKTEAQTEEVLTGKDSETVNLPSHVTESCTDEGLTQSSTPSDPYQRENIPWKSGTVQRTKQDIEGRYKDSPSGGSTSDPIMILIDGEPLKDTDIQRDVKTEHLPVEGVTVTESSDDPGSRKEQEEEGKGEEECEVSLPRSIYEMEEICLPPGIVERTKREIEERSQISVSSQDSDSSPLQRSASLKGLRVTPKRKKPDRERRRTITPILSPETSSTSDNLPTSFSDDEQLNQTARRRLELGEDRMASQGHAVGVPSEADLAVYRLMGEEVALEKGIVQKQKKDIEEKHRARLASESKDLPPGKLAKPEGDSETEGASTSSLDSQATPNTTNVPKSDLSASVPSDQTQVSAMGGTLQDTRDTRVDDGTAMPAVAVSKMKSAFEKPPETQIFAKSPKVVRKSLEGSDNDEIGRKVVVRQKEDSDLGIKSEPADNENQNGLEVKQAEDEREMRLSVSERKVNFESLSQSPESPELQKRNSGSIVKKWADRDRKSNIDPETLALIREIGTAILNSPAKKHADEEEEEEKRGDFNLVRHFVRDIERRTKKTKKPAKEILIIDKETQERKKRGCKYRFKSSPTDSEQSGSESGKTLETSVSKSSYRSRSMSGSLETEKGLPLGKDGFSPPDPRSEKSHGSDDTQHKDSVIVCDILEVQGNVQKTEQSNIELDENPIDKVRNLVGKFEVSDLKRTSSTSTVSEIISHKEKLPSPVAQSEQRSVQTNQSEHRDTERDRRQSLEKETSIAKTSSKQVPSLSLTKAELSEISALPVVHKQPNIDILPEESLQLLQLRRNLRKTSLTSSTSGRPRSAEMLKRHNTSPGLSVYNLSRFSMGRTQSEDSDSSYSWEKKKIRKMQGKSHPLTKLEYRRNNPFYNTM